jgi:hypothetical protein
MLCAACCWLEVCLTIPRRVVDDKEKGIIEVSAPQSGGEKNIVSSHAPQAACGSSY